jgi:hypothetical protein
MTNPFFCFLGRPETIAELLLMTVSDKKFLPTTSMVVDDSCNNICLTVPESYTLE